MCQLLYRLPQIFYLLPQRVQLLPNIHHPVPQGGLASTVGCVRLAGAGRGLVDALPWLASAVAFAERSVATDEGEKKVVRIVPLADVNGERRPVDRLGSLALEEIAEPTIRVSILGHRHPREARLKLIEPLGHPIEAYGPPLELHQFPLEVPHPRPNRRCACAPFGWVSGARIPRSPGPGRSALTLVAMGELEKDVPRAASVADIDGQRRPAVKPGAIPLVVEEAEPVIAVSVLARRRGSRSRSRP